MCRAIQRNCWRWVKSDVIVTGCPFCKEQFEKVFDKKKVIHYIEFISQSA